MGALFPEVSPHLKACVPAHPQRYFAKQFQFNANVLQLGLGEEEAFQVARAVADAEGTKETIPCRQFSADAEAERILEQFVRDKFPHLARPDLVARALTVAYDPTVSYPAPEDKDTTPKGHQTTLTAKGERFEIREKAGKPTLFHYQSGDKTWREFSFDLPAYWQERHPVHLEEEDGYLIVTLNDGTRSDSRILPQGMIFSPQPPLPNHDSVGRALSQIARTENYGHTEMLLDRLYPDEIVSKWFPGRIDSYWEKKRAAEYLDRQMLASSDPTSFASLDRTRQALLAALRDDETIFVEGGPYLEAVPYYQHSYVYSHRMSQYVPDEIGITREQWGYVVAPFAGGVASPAAEREAIGEAARRWKMVIGSQTGIAQDFGWWFGNLMQITSLIPFLGPVVGQTACRYDYLNTYDLIAKLQAGGFLRYHEQPPNVFEDVSSEVLGHVAGRFREKQTGHWYAIDTWPVGAGHTPVILPEEDFNMVTHFSPFIYPTAESYAETPTANRFFMSAFWLLVGTWQARNRSLRLMEKELAISGEGVARVIEVEAVDERLTGKARRRAIAAAEARAVPLREAEAARVAAARAQATLVKYPRYFRTPAGIFNFGIIAVAAYGLLTLPFSEISPDGIPEDGVPAGPEFPTLFGSLAATGFLGAEGTLAMRTGTTPLLYEVPHLYLAEELGTVLTSGATHLIGVATEREVLQTGSPVNEVIGNLGGLATLFAAIKFLPTHLKEASIEGVKRWFEGMIGPALYRAELFFLHRTWPWMVGVARAAGAARGPFLLLSMMTLLEMSDSA